MQPQLLSIPLNPKDVVSTPLWVVLDMIDFFKPSGNVLDPCKGDGQFSDLIEDCEWCEISKGRDFFAWDKPVDWCIGNPPYSMSAKWIYHTMEITQKFVYLLPCDKVFISMKMLNKMKEWGFIKHMRVYGTGNKLGFPIGFAVGALMFERGYQGPMKISYGGEGSLTVKSKV